MHKFKAMVSNSINRLMANFALSFAGGSVQRFCFYIFHQPKMPEDVKELKNKQ